jgi:hypothetical protein
VLGRSPRLREVGDRLGFVGAGKEPPAKGGGRPSRVDPCSIKPDSRSGNEVGYLFGVWILVNWQTQQQGESPATKECLRLCRGWKEVGVGRRMWKATAPDTCAVGELVV